MKIIKEFFYVFAFSITGLIFGFSFFLLFSNIYSYKEVNSSYVVQDTDLSVYKEMKRKLTSIREIANSFNSSNYNGSEDLFGMVQLQSKLNICVDKIDTSSFDRLLTKNKIYIKDTIEHQIPQRWAKKIGVHSNDIIKSLGAYVKAEVILVIIAFIIVLIGLYILKFMHFNVPYPFLTAIGIGFVDALPILRVRNSDDAMGNNRSIERGLKTWNCNSNNLCNCFSCKATT